KHTHSHTLKPSLQLQLDAVSGASCIIQSNPERKKICIMGLASQYVVMCVWSAVCVRPQDPPLLNSTSPPCFIMMGDNPYTKCDVDTNPKSSSAVTRSDPSTVSTINPTSTTMESSTAKPKPATVTPTVHPSPNSPDETKFTTKTPTLSPMIVDESVHKDLEDGGNKTGSPNCASVWMGVHTEVFLLGVCGVLMLIMVTLSFCLYKQCKKQPVENLHLTRLISIPNPAFYNP
ncbi:hypothetical protein PO909_012147, partial [Leuciscus waleckii]